MHKLGEKKTMKDALNEFNKLTGRIKKFFNPKGEKRITEYDLLGLIERNLSVKFNLKDGFNTLLSDEKNYMELIKKLGYDYYSDFVKLTDKYTDVTTSLPDSKKEICSNMHVVVLENNITKNKVLGVRDILNLDFDLLSEFYFSKIIVLGEDILSEVFGDKEQLILAGNNDFESDEEIDKYFKKIMNQAILMGTSDIHIQKSQKDAELWFRIDGLKVEMGKMPIKTSRILKRRLITLADQEDSDFDSVDGIINYEFGKRKIKFRLGMINSKMNFSLVMRIIGGKTEISSDLTSLNYSERMQKAFEHMIRFQNGMVLVTGQVGSGKTQLMYALLKKLAEQGKYVVTIEHPVEYLVDEFFQIDLSEYDSASEEFKYGYPEAIIDILRQDSDIILIGETREEKTANQLVNASNLGQLVFTTMHTNSARATISRLTNSLGVEENDLVDNLRSIVSQKLVRMLCDNCKIEDGQGGFKSCGCEVCKNSGFKGRIPVPEVIIFKMGKGADFEDNYEYITLEESCEIQYKKGFISKEDSIKIVKGEELW